MGNVGQMQIIQLKFSRGDNFIYIIGCEKTGEAVVIDPSGDVERIVSEIQGRNWKLRTIINTHGHGDHTGGNKALKKTTGARILMHCADAGQYPEIDRCVNEESLQVGNITFQIIHTPGHTPGGICLYAEGNLFTGDTLFVGDSGRTDLPGGHRPTLGASIRKLMKLDENTVIWPGHDYGPMPHSTLAWEKKHNVNAKEYGYYKGP